MCVFKFETTAFGYFGYISCFVLVKICNFRGDVANILSTKNRYCRREEAALKAGGHDSDDEKGTADVDFSGTASKSKGSKHRIKRKAEEVDALAGTGLESDEEGAHKPT